MGGYVGIVAAILSDRWHLGQSRWPALGPQELSIPDALKVTDALGKKLPESFYPWIMIGLTLAAFPGACFSSFIAANSFKTVMPKVNPFLSVGIGAVVSIVLALTGSLDDLPTFS